MGILTGILMIILAVYIVIVFVLFDEVDAKFSKRLFLISFEYLIYIMIGGICGIVVVLLLYYGIINILINI